MYTAYFGFREKPFNITPDARFFYTNQAYQEAYASLLYGIRERQGFVVLTGEVGTGKTTLLRRLMVNLEANVRVVFFYNTTLTFEELLSFTCEEFGLAVKEKGRLEQLQTLNAFLIKQLENGGTAVLLIDEAQNLKEEVLENLRLLSNLEASGEKLLQIVFVGQPELESKLKQPSLRQLKQRIALHCHLDRLKDREVGAFIHYRLRAVGYEREDLFAPAALQRIALYTKGIPRLINIVCDNALLIAYATSQKTISAAVIDEVARDLRLAEEAQTPGDLILQAAVNHQQLDSWEDSETTAPRFSPPQQRKLAWVGTLTALFLLSGAMVLSPLSSKDRPTDFGSTVKNLIASLEQRFGLAPSDLYGRTSTSPLPPPLGMDREEQQDWALPNSATPPQEQDSPPPLPSADKSEAQEKPVPLDFPASVELKKEATSTGVALTQPSRFLLTPLASSTRKERPFVIQRGSTISRIAADTYGPNLFLAIDLLKEFNPHVENFNWVLAGQTLWLPPLTQDTLLRKEEGGSYRFVLAAFRSQQNAQQFARTVRLKGFTASITPRRISDDTWLYRVEITELKNQEAATGAWEVARTNRWLVLEENLSRRPGH